MGTRYTHAVEVTMVPVPEWVIGRRLPHGTNHGSPGGTMNGRASADRDRREGFECSAETTRPCLLGRTAALCTLSGEAERRGSGWRSHVATRGGIRDGAAPLIGASAVMRALRERIERVAATDFTVLIEGETGSGKELVARQIHELSQRRRGAFVAVNCAALVESLLEAELFGIEDRTATGVRGRKGKFECASGGTLFLDEVADLSASAQAKLLRAIQECSIERVGSHESRRVDIRLVVATNRRLGQLVAQGLFRSDLFYRLSGVDLRVPPLRTRRDDVLELAQYFLERLRGDRPVRWSSAAADALATYDWPGNVRELERLVEASLTLVRSDQVELEDLPLPVRGRYKEVLQPSLRQSESLRAWGSRYVRLVYQQCRGNKREACRVLDISYHTLQSYLQHGMVASPTEEAGAAAPVWPAHGSASHVHECDDGGTHPDSSIDAALTQQLQR